MSKITNALGLILIVGMIAVGCDSVVDGDSVTQESLTQSEFTGENSVMHGSAITSPKSGEVVYENSLVLTANDPNIGETTADDVHWALVVETDADSRPCTGDIKFNRVNDPYTFEDGVFEASVDLQELEAGEYCFVFNTELENPEHGDRVVQYFYIVDEYAKVGGNIDNEDYLIDNHKDLDLKELVGKKQLSHAFSGVVGNAGSEGTVGSITINYRQLGESIEFEADNLTLDSAQGVGVSDETAKGTVLTVGGTNISLLDKDANPDFYRGAVTVRFNGTPSMSKYEIDNTPNSTGADSWIGLENGNVEVGIRKNQ